MFERVFYEENRVPWIEVIVMDPREVSVMGEMYLHGKECNPYGLLVRGPRDYVNRHRDGDGISWKMIPLKGIVKRVPMEYSGNRLKAVTPNPEAGQ